MTAPNPRPSRCPRSELRPNPRFPSVRSRHRPRPPFRLRRLRSRPRLPRLPGHLPSHRRHPNLRHLRHRPRRKRRPSASWWAVSNCLSGDARVHDPRRRHRSSRRRRSSNSGAPSLRAVVRACRLLRRSEVRDSRVDPIATVLRVRSNGSRRRLRLRLRRPSRRLGLARDRGSPPCFPITRRRLPAR